MLPAIDQQFLNDIAPGNVVAMDGGMICLTLPGFTLPAGFTVGATDLMLRLSPGYPDVPPDMWWFAPFVLRSDGRAIPATEVRELHLGREWQRWSRHLQPGQWRPGIDCLQSFISLVRAELRRAGMAVAA